jgi:hypothetical protein
LQKQPGGFYNVRHRDRQWQEQANVFAFSCELRQRYEDDLNAWPVGTRHQREGKTV